MPVLAGAFLFSPERWEPRPPRPGGIARAANPVPRRAQTHGTGHCQWLKGAKGHGPIQVEDGEDVLVHDSAIQTRGFTSLAEGNEVEFEATTGPKGLQASNVRKVIQLRR